MEFHKRPEPPSIFFHETVSNETHERIVFKSKHVKRKSNSKRTLSSVSMLSERWVAAIWCWDSDRMFEKHCCLTTALCYSRTTQGPLSKLGLFLVEHSQLEIMNSCRSRISRVQEHRVGDNRGLSPWLHRLKRWFLVEMVGFVPRNDRLVRLQSKMGRTLE